MDYHYDKTKHIYIKYEENLSELCVTIVFKKKFKKCSVLNVSNLNLFMIANTPNFIFVLLKICVVGTLDQNPTLSKINREDMCYIYEDN